MSFDFDLYGCNVFSDTVMRERLPEETYAQLKATIDAGEPLTLKIAAVVADCMKNWAIEKGATHFTHWFQPLTNVTAGKHDSFISPVEDGKIMLHFSAKELAKGEPDASSFPSGGLRNTFEARGYTVWDSTSPAFVRDGTLYIPTAFCSYTGEALDTKTPLLRSMKIISDSALNLLRCFGDTKATKVLSTVGAEQEYFLIDRALYEKRLDLKICGRTLFGSPPPKGQEMDDHYFGRIRLRVGDFMRDLDHELWKLGVPIKTKHNEVAPTQHELAPVFDTVNVACDHNQLTMEMMRIIAKKNGLACLLHEKPFDGVNGSGKHNNWSISTDTGENLLEPGKNPYKNIQFLTFLSAIITAVDKHADLLRLSASIAGNDYRLGANEAPPAIISIFLGEQLTDVLKSIGSNNKVSSSPTDALSVGVETLPQLQKDDSDRNRTSPFAFTGNKFEFRMVGSSASIAFANTVLNTIVAQTLDEFTARIKASKDFDTEIRNIIKDTLKNHGRVIFNGNNYTDEWVAKAEKRGLPNLKNTVDAAGVYIDAKNIELFKNSNVLTEIECHSRYEIMLENYCKIINIEAKTALEMANRQIYPAVISYLGELSKSYNALKKVTKTDNNALHKLITDISALSQKIARNSEILENTIECANCKNTYDYAVYCRDLILPQMNKLRKYVDATEQIVQTTKWPMPSYTDLLHRV